MGKSNLIEYTPEYKRLQSELKDLVAKRNRSRVSSTKRLYMEQIYIIDSRLEELKKQK